VHREGKHYSRDCRTGAMTLLREDLHQLAGAANQTQRVFARADAHRLVKIRPAEAILASGAQDYVIEARKAFPDQFMMTGVVGTFWQCTGHVGETNLFSMPMPSASRRA